MHQGELVRGTRFGRYTIERVIGRGGMGVVYTAREDGLNRMVALKVIAPELAQDEAFRIRFLREGRVAAGLEHPNVVPVFAADEVDGQPYISMRYVPGTDLKTLIATVGRLDPARAIAIFLPLADALDAAHDLGLVHRDVKPANILVGPDGRDGLPRVYLTDLGLTRETTGSRLTQQGMLVGTVEYMAPEQVEGRALDGSADQYALAASLYEALTGRLPFEAPSLTALLVAKLRDLPPLPSSLRPELGLEFDRVAERAMALAPDARFASCTAFVRAARAALPETVATSPVAGRTVIEPSPTLPPVAREADTRERPVPEEVDPSGETREQPAPPIAFVVGSVAVPTAAPGTPTGSEPPVADDAAVAEPVGMPVASVPAPVADDSGVAEIADADGSHDDEAPGSGVTADTDAPSGATLPDTDEPAPEPIAPMAGTAVAGGTVVQAAAGDAAAAESGTADAPPAPAPRTTVDPAADDRARPTRVGRGEPAGDRGPKPGAPVERPDPTPRVEPAAQRSRTALLVGGGLAVLAVVGVGAALAIGGGGGSGGGETTAAAGTAPAASVASSGAAATTATGASSGAGSTAATAPPPGPAGAPTVTDHPKAGWAPATSGEVFAFARDPQDGVVEYSVPASGLTYRVVVHGDDLVVDVAFERGDYEREWVRYRDTRLARACVKPRGGRYRCGATAPTLGLNSADYGDLLQVRDGYVDSLTTVPAIKSLRSSGKVNDVRMDRRLGFPVVCAIPKQGQTTRLCVQENGFITQWRAGDTRITATRLRVAASEADLRAPA